LISTWQHYCKSAKIHYDPTDIPENQLRMVVFGPKEHVAQAKAVIEDEVRIILQRLDYDRRDKEADRELRQWSYTQKDEESKGNRKESGNRGNTRNTGRDNANREQYEENKNESNEEKTEQKNENENDDQHDNEENEEEHDQGWNDDAEHGDYDPEAAGYDGYDEYGNEQGFEDYEYGYDDEAQGDEERPHGGGGRRGQRQNRRERKPQFVYVQKGTKSQDPNATQSNQ